MVRIGQASIDENGKAKGGKAGNQTGKELNIKNWYNGGWHTVLRAKDPKVAERMAINCEIGCNNKNIGYDQNQRNTLRTEAVKTRFDLSKVEPCETDCSAYMSVCAEASGVAMYGQYTSGNAPTTANMVQKFYNTGMFDVLTNKTYLNRDDHLKRGDILVKKGHTVMVLDNGINQYDKPVISKGDKGSWVSLLQGKLNIKGYKIAIDGDFGENTKIALISFQGQNNLVKDGICGQLTWGKLL